MYSIPEQGMAKIKPVDIHPFTEANLYEAGMSGNEEKLEMILEQFAPERFAVLSIEDQVFLDKSRAVVDASKDSGGYGLVWKVLFGSRDCTILLRKLLSVGVDPDLPDKRGIRPSHACGHLSFRLAAECLFLCRPDMKARDLYGNSPLQAANVTYAVSLCMVRLPAYRSIVAWFGLSESV
jgi:hypothetical protein